MKTEHITNISLIFHKYDAFLFDIFGVLHDGGEIFADTLKTISNLTAAKKSVFFLTNAPHRAHFVIEQLKQVGIDESLYYGILTAGDQAHHFLQTKPNPTYTKLGKTCYFIGTTTMLDILPTEEYVVTRDIDTADFILVAGPESPESTLEQYEDILKRGAKHALPMVCSNPDLQVFRLGQQEIRAGRLAAFYRSLGGDVTYCGKPFRATYDLLSRLLRGVKRERMLMIGDSLYTDVAGANLAGIDSLLTISKNTLFEIGYDDDTIDCASFASLIRKLDDQRSIPTYFTHPLRW